MYLRCAIHGFAGHIRRLNGRSNPEPPQLEWGGFGGVGERFPNEGRCGLSEETFAAPPKPAWASESEQSLASVMGPG